MQSNIQQLRHHRGYPLNNQESQMLVLTRKLNEAVFVFPNNVSPDITVKGLFSSSQIEILESNRNHVKIGIHAPDQLTIIRDKLC